MVMSWIKMAPESQITIRKHYIKHDHSVVQVIGKAKGYRLNHLIMCFLDHEIKGPTTLQFTIRQKLLSTSSRKTVLQCVSTTTRKGTYRSKSGNKKETISVSLLINDQTRCQRGFQTELTKATHFILSVQIEV